MNLVTILPLIRHLDAEVLQTLKGAQESAKSVEKVIAIEAQHRRVGIAVHKLPQADLVFGWELTQVPQESHRLRTIVDEQNPQMWHRDVGLDDPAVLAQLKIRDA